MFPSLEEEFHLMRVYSLFVHDDISKMTIAFKCRIQYNSDIPKIKKFFEETDTINLGAGEAGIALFATTAKDVCNYIVQIHS